MLSVPSSTIASEMAMWLATFQFLGAGEKYALQMKRSANSAPATFSGGLSFKPAFNIRALV